MCKFYKQMDTGQKSDQKSSLELSAQLSYKWNVAVDSLLFSASVAFCYHSSTNILLSSNEVLSFKCTSWSVSFGSKSIWES